MRNLERTHKSTHDSVRNFTPGANTLGKYDHDYIRSL